MITVAQQLILFVAAGVLYLFLAQGSVISSRTTLAVRLLFGLCCVEFALGHFTGIRATAAMIPSWIPLSGAFWTVLTGIAFLLAGLAIITGILDVLSADRQGRDAQLVEALNAAFLASHNRAEAGTRSRADQAMMR